jgi:tetratricopeptide (TPR) repeat protein
VDSAVAAVATVIAALIGLWGVIYQKTGRLFWWRKPNPSPIKPPVGNHDSPASGFYDFTERGLRSFNQGQYQIALNYYQQALVIAREVGDRAGEGTALHNIGRVYYDHSQYDQALHNYQ